jgi:DNA-directed RNA polymerase specialized sigma24 family protein
MGFAEIAQVLGIASSTARVHAQAGRETLKTLLIEQHPDWWHERGSSGGASP